MKDFFKYLGTLLFSFISGFGGFLIKNVEFMIGILAIAIIIYVIYILVSDEKDKASKIVTAFAGLVGGIATAASIAK